jgi:hypothetical protein
MIRFAARIWAKHKYVFSQYAEAATNDLNAGLSLRLAGEKRTLIQKLNKEADDIEANIKSVDEKLTAGYWECEGGHEWASMPKVRPTKDRPANLCVVRVNGNECGGEVKLIKREQMTGQEKYESDKERGEAEKIAKSKREQAKAEEGNLADCEKTAKYFKGLADNNRKVAEKIKSL